MSNPFKNWTSLDVAAFNSRNDRATERAIDAPQCPDGDEYKLHEFIIAECKRRSWISFHGSMAHKTFREKGEPDFQLLGKVKTVDEIFSDKAKHTVTGEEMAFFSRKEIEEIQNNAKPKLIECKTRTSKLSPDQQAIIHWAKTLGHVIHVVRSEQEFLDVIK